MGADKTSQNELDELIEIVLNPNTSPEKLVELSQIDDFEIRKYIPLNHRTPYDVIEMLIDDTTHDYSILVDDTLVFPTHLQQKIDKSAKINAQIMREDNPDKLRKLFDTVPHKFMLNFTINDHTPTDILEKIFTFNLAPLNRRIASNRNTPVSIFEKLIETDDQKTWDNLVENPKAPPHILSEIAKRGNYYALLLKNPNTPASVLTTIYDNSKHSETIDHTIDHAIASHKNTGSDLLDRLLIETKDHGIKEIIAKHPNTSSKTLESLVDTIPMREGEFFDYYFIPKPQKNKIINIPSDYFIFTEPSFLNLGYDLALNPNTPPRALEKLFNHGWTFKEKLLLNPNTPEGIREQINSDVTAMRTVMDDDVSQAELDTFVDYYHPFVRVQIASNPNTSQSSLSKLAEDDNFIVQMMVASNFKTPESALRTLSTHSNMAIRWNVVKNHKTPDDVLHSLLDEDIDFLIAIAENQNALPKTIDEANNRKNQLMFDRTTARNHSTPKEVLAKLSERKDFDVKYFVALNPNTPENVLDKLAFEPRSESKIPFKRIISYKDYSEQVAKNPKTSESTIRKIYETKPNIKVKRAIMDNPQTPSEIRKHMVDSLIHESESVDRDPNLNEDEKQLKKRRLNDLIQYLTTKPRNHDEEMRFRSLCSRVEDSSLYDEWTL